MGLVLNLISFSPGPESLPTSQTRSRAAGPGRPETRDARSSAAGFESHPFPDPRPSRSDLPACGLFTGSRPDPRCVRSPLATCALALCASRSRPGLRALPRLRESADPRLLQKRPGPAAGSPPRSPPHTPVPGRCWCSWICKEFACLQMPSVSPLWVSWSCVAEPRDGWLITFHFVIGFVTMLPTHSTQWPRNPHLFVPSYGNQDSF